MFDNEYKQNSRQLNWMLAQQLFKYKGLKTYIAYNFNSLCLFHAVCTQRTSKEPEWE